MSPAEKEPLLHSLVLFWDQIERSLELVTPERIVEIGSEAGHLTARLTEWAEQQGAHVTSIDPGPAAATRGLADRSDHLSLVEEPSPWALATIERADLYVIDGDHNYWTVAAELEHVFGDASAPALAIMHDVGWPWARRDLYYAPARLPAEAVHPHSYRGGVVRGETRLVPGGFRGRGSFAAAEQEGGECNGVLTAVEDMIGRRPDLRLIRIPCVFGVGFLFPARAAWADELDAALSPLHELPLLDTLEANRLELYLRLIETGDQLDRDRLRTDRLLTQLTDRIETLTAENLALRLHTAQERTEPS